jgi:hypothetical protein
MWSGGECARHIEYNHEGKRLFYGETLLQGLPGL